MTWRELWQSTMESLRGLFRGRPPEARPPDRPTLPDSASSTIGQRLPATPSRPRAPRVAPQDEPRRPRVLPEQPPDEPPPTVRWIPSDPAATTAPHPVHPEERMDQPPAEPRPDDVMPEERRPAPHAPAPGEPEAATAPAPTTDMRAEEEQGPDEAATEEIHEEIHAAPPDEKFDTAPESWATAPAESEPPAAGTHEEPLVLTHLLESLLFVAGEPVAPADLARALALPEAEILEGLTHLANHYRASGRGLRLQIFNGKYQLVTAPAAAVHIEAFLNLETTTRLSGPALETLAVIAYRQPVTRAQIEAIRGVDCAGVLRSLTQRGLIAEVGRLETVGRPILYGVTELFMQHFGLSELAELPPLEETEADRLWAASVLADKEDASGETA